VSVTLTEEEIGFLKVGRSGKGRTQDYRPKSRAGLLRLVQFQYVSERPVSLDTVLYVITDTGRNALAQAE
jgi:hypothetical protein